MRQKVAPDVIMGRKFIALAVSEPQAGSDVAGMVTTAKKGIYLLLIHYSFMYLSIHSFILLFIFIHCFRR